MASAGALSRRIKALRNYDVSEIATALRMHRNTVRQWLSNGLATIDDRRPKIVLGSELRRFLDARSATRKRRCPPATIYCVRCREPRRPAGGMAEYKPISATAGNLVGICPVCDAMMNRRVSVASLALVCSDLDVTTTQRESRIGDRP